MMMRLRPPNPRTELVARVWGQGDQLFVVLGDNEKDAALRDVVKARGFRFSFQKAAWARTLVARHGSPAHRAAEIAHRLLAAGFPVEVADDVADLVIHASYEPEVTRWVLACESGQYTGWLLLEWSRDDDYYEQARRIPGNRYDIDLHRVVVPPEQFEMAGDFAQLYGFSISDEARAIIEAADARKRAALVIDVLPLPTAAARPDPLKLHLQTEGEGIDPRLADDNGAV